GEYFPDTDVV
ncbi:hypothetical protein Tsp_11358, partial [Trichinella spiralis]